MILEAQKFMRTPKIILLVFLIAVKINFGYNKTQLCRQKKIPIKTFRT